MDRFARSPVHHSVKRWARKNNHRVIYLSEENTEFIDLKMKRITNLLDGVEQNDSITVKQLKDLRSELFQYINTVKESILNSIEKSISSLKNEITTEQTIRLENFRQTFKTELQREINNYIVSLKEKIMQKYGATTTEEIVE